MQLHTQEHYDLMAHFERAFKHLRLDREKKELWSRQFIYQNGEANDLFLAFRKGYALGKKVEMQEAKP